ncbi:hypothetical protein [Paraburkholderia caribensis]|uniref:hypothetical protein n=1 Tax=Paraburkholderia caribensis TaxID=75105 RepID=UPI001CC3ED69|nr:hypothetical protein [Paraburkholderia caribensis]
MAPELFFVIPVVRRDALELVMDGVKGIRSLSGVAIKIITPFNEEFFRCYSPAEGLEAVALVDVENVECNTFRSNAANTPLLAALTCAAAVAEEGCPRVLIFVGLESCADTLADYEFLLRRRFAPARLFVLDTQPMTSPSLRATEMANGSSLHTSTIRLLPPQQKRVERQAREGARAAFGLTETDFAVLIPDDESVREESSRNARFVRALLKAPNTHFLAGPILLGSGASSVGVPLVDADIAVPFLANALDAADMVVSFGSKKSVSGCSFDAAAGNFLAVRNDHTEKFALLIDSDACDAIDDFIEAIDMLPRNADRSAEMLRYALVRDLQARASLAFGRSLFRVITQNHGAQA